MDFSADSKDSEHCLQVRSEIGTLETVLLHRPGRELESLTPQYLDAMLFEDIPFLEKMREEHNKFAKTLSEHGTQVLYFDELLKETLQVPGIREDLISQTVQLAEIKYDSLYKAITDYLHSLSAEALGDHLIGGLLKQEIDHKDVEKSLSYFIRDAYPYYINPLPNLYFTRDPGSVLGNGISINEMQTAARRRETQLLSMIMRKHPALSQQAGMVYEGYAANSNIEGGDILVLNDETLAVGCSARTAAWAVEELARIMLAPEDAGGQGFKQVLVMQIPFTRAYMHLDTVFTMVDHDKFTIYPGIESRLKVFQITLQKSEHGEKWSIKVETEDSIRQALCRALHVPSVDLIQTGGGDMITAAREQWNDSTNTLAVAPGTVVTYRRNMVSNDTLSQHGIQVLPIEGSELVRGRGGPRCMSMPLRRSPV
ncbi:MAG: arginine deiminase [Spirochaetales bacterium]|nr:arginine deiminase [Spirochaetales bacterium]